MFRSVLVLAAAVGPAVALSMPEAGTPPPNAVPFETIQEVALARAAHEFPGAKLGTVIPYVDESGYTAAHAFVFRCDGKSFPDYEQVADDILAERELLTPNTDLTHWKSKYASVLVSARRDRTPVYSFGYGVPAFYAIGGQALARAQELLGWDARLSRIYFVCPSEFLEFSTAAGRRVVLTDHFETSWQSRQEFTDRLGQERVELEARYPTDKARAAELYGREWDRELAGGFDRFVDVFVPQAERAPFYDWSYGCTPTSAAMVMGYIDRVGDYGRLVDHYAYRRDGVENENDWQIPNVQLECAIGMFTDTTRGATYLQYIAEGLLYVATQNGYSFTSTDEMGAEWNDWAWQTIMDEIDAGHPMVWSATWAIHSLAGYGYRTDSQYVYVHNTWWQPAAWWSHSGPNWSHVAALTTSGGDPHKLEMTYPLGDTFYNSTGRGEVVYVGDSVPVRWTNSGPAGTAVKVEFSTDCGRNWQLITAEAPDNGEYRWVIESTMQSNESTRVRLTQYNGGTVTSGDASFGNFRVQREPLGPRQLAPPNGLPVTSPPIVLVVDSATARCDSFEFKLAYLTDTIWVQRGTSPRCPLPDSLFLYNKTYKWICRGHNQFGWGNYATVWSFRILWNAVAEAPVKTGGQPVRTPGLHRIADGEVRFTLPPATFGQRFVIYDALGKAVRQLTVPDDGRLTWDLRGAQGRKVGAGLYFYRAGTDGASRTGRLVLVD